MELITRNKNYGIIYNNYGENVKRHLPIRAFLRWRRTIIMTIRRNYDHMETGTLT